MATRKIKDAKDLSTNELIYFKGHAKATYMSDGRNVEEAINQIGTGGGGGGGSSSGAYPIVEIDLAEINELSPNTYYRFLAGLNPLESAEFVLLPPSDTSIVNEYVFEYYNETGGNGGGSVMPFVFPEEIMWEGGNAPSFSKDYTIVSIVNNLGVFAEF